MFLAVAMAGASLEVFLRGEGLRSRVEATLSRALGRNVTIRSLEISIASGSLVARHMVIQEDPRFGSQPFVQTENVRMGIEMVPLLLRRQVHLDRFVFESPRIHLVRDREGAWNYATVAKTERPIEARPGSRNALPQLAISSIEVKDGQVVVDMDARKGAPVGWRRLSYDHLDLSVRDFGLANSFPFRIAAGLGAGGSLEVSGRAGPFNGQDASATPLLAHIEARGLDLQASGLVQPSSGLSGALDRVTVDVGWSDHQIQVSNIDAASSELAIERSASAPGTLSKPSVWREIRDHLSVREAHVKIRSLRIGRAGVRSTTYRLIEGQVSHWAPDQRGAFSVSGHLPGNGSLLAKGTGRLAADGRSGPGPQTLEVNADVIVRHLDLRTSGLLPAGSHLEGLADVETHLRSERDQLLVAGSARIAGLKLASNGQPSVKPVEARFNIRHKAGVDGAESSGVIERASVSVGGATLNVAGAY